MCQSKIKDKAIPEHLSTLSSLQRLGENNLEYESYWAIINPYYILTFSCTFITIIRLYSYSTDRNASLVSGEIILTSLEQFYTECIFMALQVLNLT